jgi:predicted acyl esterase
MHRHRLLLALLLLPVLLTGSASCHDAARAFLSPREGSVSESDVRVELWLPGFTPPLLRLDGQRLDPAGFERRGLRVSGVLPDVPPGPHRLTAVSFLFFLPIRATTHFEVALPAGFEARGSVEQVFVTHAEPGQPLDLLDARGRSRDEGSADVQGSLVFREVRPGVGYRVLSRGAPSQLSPPLEVMSVAGSTPPQDFYAAQVLEPGYGYLTTRDGTKLSVFVSLPGPPEDGPYPTLVNYSGYQPSEPGRPIELEGVDVEPLCGTLPVLCAVPNHPSGLIAGVLGYATVGVNMRGTGCSGGAYDFFEPLQVLDGYDAIEIVAAQPWVRHHEVGMAGISYPGISQLFVASAQPPSLAAITPLSVISGVDTTLAPGGILNNGFAVQWGEGVLDGADPYGQGWEQGRVDAGDAVCAENQLLHSQKVDIIQKALDHPFYEPEVYDPLNPRTFVDRIQVPVFTAGAWQDEQTGNHFPDLWTRFTHAPLVRMTGYNGAHADGYAPQVLAEWKNFLDFYVAREIVPLPFLVELFAPILFQEVFGAPVDWPAPRFDPSMDFQQALAAYEGEEPVRIIFESGGGAGGSAPGAPEGAFELFFDQWPPPQTQARRWYFHADGSLREFTPSEAESASSFQHDNAKGAETYAVNDDFETALPDIQWLPWRPGRQVVFVSEPLAEDLVVLGHASADLWIQSTAADADLEVMVSEVRPDGLEAYVSSGWLRASQRKLSPESTPLKPVQTHLEADAAPLPAGHWELVRVEIYPFGHVFRAGSRLRISVSTPGGNKGRWQFDVLQFDGPVTHAVSHSASFASSVLLPVIPDVQVPTGLPACPGLRSQPCREYVPHLNARLD